MRCVNGLNCLRVYKPATFSSEQRDLGQKANATDDYLCTEHRKLSFVHAFCRNLLQSSIVSTTMSAALLTPMLCPLLK